jgi:hypothetical protein
MWIMTCVFIIVYVLAFIWALRVLFTESRKTKEELEKCDILIKKLRQDSYDRFVPLRVLYGDRSVPIRLTNKSFTWWLDMHAQIVNEYTLKYPFKCKFGILIVTSFGNSLLPLNKDDIDTMQTNDRMVFMVQCPELTSILNVEIEKCYLVYNDRYLKSYVPSDTTVVKPGEVTKLPAFRFEVAL